MYTTATLLKTASLVSDILLSAFWTDEYWEIIFNVVLGPLFPGEGLLLLSGTGQLMQSNPKARELCRSVQPGLTSHEVKESVCYFDITLPRQITQCYEGLIADLLDYPGQPFLVSEEVCLDTGLKIKLMIERIALAENGVPYWLVRLEDVAQTALQQSCWDAHRYHLTQREREVWELALQDLSYQDIGDQLFISRDTVSKHLKNVYSKRRGDE
ncbi:MAG: helix-turn-helix transcriptional regulator [Cyanobacteria bacterium P01_D01_bin.56]